MVRPDRTILAAVVLTGLLGGGTAWAEGVAGGPLFGEPGFVPRVPVSALARPAAWFDPSQLQVSTSVSVGSTGSGRGVDGIQVTRLSYRFGSPLWMNVSLGNRWGPGAARTGGSFFLEGLDLAYRPHPSLLFQIHYQDIRSPLQLSPYPGYGLWSP